MPAQIGPAELRSLLGSWAEEGDGALHRRLAAVVRSRIASGLLTPGSALPAERALAAALAVSRTTLVAALDELRSEGLIDSRQGSANRVAVLGQAPSLRGLASIIGAAPSINLAIGAPADARMLTDLKVSADDLLALTPSHGYEFAGWHQLRERLAELEGATPAEVMVTNGAHHALALALALVPRGGRVLVEDPTYPGTLDIISGLGLRVVPMPVLASIGAARLRKLLDDASVAAVVVQPRVHAPTGATVTPERWAAAQRILDRPGLLVIEDDALGELAHPGVEVGARSRPRTIRAHTIRIGSVSKVAWGGLRVGWLSAPVQLVAEMTHRRLDNDLGTSLPAQIFAKRILDRWDDLTAGRQRHLAIVTRTMTSLLQEYLPEWKIAPATGGLSLWVDVGAARSTLVDRAAAYGVSVASGAAASAGGGETRHLRICVDRSTPELTEGVKRLTAAWQSLT